MRRMWLWITIGFAAFLVILAYTSIGMRKNRVEVCIEFNGRTSCRIASGATPEQARRAATENACAFIASGVGDTIACQNRTPLSVKNLDVPAR
jgi:hypothetical protein